MKDNEYLPKKLNWFRLPDYMSKIVGAGSIEDISVVDATDATTAAALANANKAKINELLATLRKAGILE